MKIGSYLPNSKMLITTAICMAIVFAAVSMAPAEWKLKKYFSV